MAETPYRIFFGDLHTHNECGLGTGTMEETIETARRNLDFFAFTGHASWHDMPGDGSGPERYSGYERLKAQWPWVQCLIADAYQEGAFVPFLGFEWQSDRYGDQCVLFPEDYQALIYPSDLDTLRTYCRQRGALLIPHHLDRPARERGIHWPSYTQECSPVVEVFTGDLGSAPDRARIVEASVQGALAEGKRFGFTGSSDTRTGEPGAKGAAMTAVLATELTRAGIFAALRARRTYALCGDRMSVDFTVDGHPVGAAVSVRDKARACFSVKGGDTLDSVEIVLGGRVVAAEHPAASSWASGGIDLEIPDGGGFVYLRVRQNNGSQAWTSPHFLERMG